MPVYFLIAFICSFHCRVEFFSKYKKANQLLNRPKQCDYVEREKSNEQQLQKANNNKITKGANET